MTHSQKKIPGVCRASRLLAGATAILVLAACASTPMPPSEQLQAAQLAITGAEQERATEFAPLDMKQAHDKLGAANAAVVDENMVLALWLADEARVSAELASAKASEAKARAVNDEMQQSIQALQQELNRNSGARP
jgi:hypothetical protein